jgi:hypothetical protein
MIATASLSHDVSRRAIDAHFVGRAVPELEAAMRAHTLRCVACRRYYDRRLILARLDPAAPPAKARIAQGLGLEIGAQRSTTGAVRWAALAVPAMVAVFLIARPNRIAPPAPTDASEGAYVARSANAAAATNPELWIYRVGSDGHPRLAQGEAKAADELAFAYANPAGKPFVLVFGVDEHRHVYWFHPAWLPGQAPPSAVAAAPGPGPHELREAIRPALDGRRLVVRALFADRPLQARDIEARVRSEMPLHFPSTEGVQMVVRALRVLP